MKIKKLAAFCLTAAIIISAVLGTGVFSVSAYNPGIIVTPDWVNTSSVSTILTYSGTTAKCRVEIEALSGTTLITADMYLYLKNSNGSYTEVEKWLNEKVDGNYLYISKTKTITSGNTYKLSVTGKVTCNGYTETVTGEVEVKAP